VTRVKLSTTAAGLLGILAQPGGAIRPNGIGAWEACSGIGRSGPRVRWTYIVAWSRRGWLTETERGVYRLTAAGRAALESEAA
jgi:hypothetical protein